MPDACPTGKFDGLVARGNIVVGVTWDRMCPIEVKLKPGFNCDLAVECKRITSFQIINQNGNIIQYSVTSHNRIAFKAHGGDCYTIKKLN